MTTPTPTILEVMDEGAVRTLWLNRPAVHNAFDEQLIARLTEELRAAGADSSVRVIVLGGRGRSFCAGGDLHWMQRAARQGEQENLADARRLALGGQHGLPRSHR